MNISSRLTTRPENRFVAITSPLLLLGAVMIFQSAIFAWLLLGILVARRGSPVWLTAAAVHPRCERAVCNSYAPDSRYH
jgi:hypothetical protein